MIFSVFIFMFSLLSGLVLSNYSGAQSKASDVERKSDINSLYQKLEEHYNEDGEYPTTATLTVNYEVKLPSLDPEALIDPTGARIQEGDYTYTPTDCTALGCAHYTLTAKLDDGTDYTKQSLN